jgi:hypothetical protein
VIHFSLPIDGNGGENGDRGENHKACGEEKPDGGEDHAILPNVRQDGILSYTKEVIIRCGRDDRF